MTEDNEIKKGSYEHTFRIENSRPKKSNIRGPQIKTNFLDRNFPRKKSNKRGPENRTNFLDRKFQSKKSYKSRHHCIDYHNSRLYS